jgi:hypothetical protein
MWGFCQAFIINIPLLDIEIGRLQGKGQNIPFFAHEEFFPNSPSNLSLPKYSEAMDCHFSTIPSLLVQKKCHRYSSFILHYIKDEAIK